MVALKGIPARDPLGKATLPPGNSNVLARHGNDHAAGTKDKDDGNATILL